MIRKILSPVPTENIADFRKAYRRINVSRFKYIAFALAVLMPIVFVWVYLTKDQNPDTRTHYYLIMYAIITVVMVGFSILFYRIERSFDKHSQVVIQASILSFSAFSLCSFACITLFEQWFSGQIVIYTMAMLAIAFTAVFLPTTLLMMFAGVQVLFIIFLPQFQSNPQLLSDNLINSTAFIAISWVLSCIRYKSFVGEYKTRIEIEEKTEQLNQINQRLEVLSKTDSLTGVYNRFEFDNRLRSEWERCKSGSIPLSLIIVDIDFFKEINDHYGHQVGDDCLKQIAGIMASCARRSTDVLARHGGDEFAILLADINEISILKFTENMRMKVEQQAIPNQYSPISKYITISLGVCTLIPSESNTVDEFFRMADQALYKAKERRNCFVAV